MARRLSSAEASEAEGAGDEDFDGIDHQFEGEEVGYNGDGTPDAGDADEASEAATSGWTPELASQPTRAGPKVVRPCRVWIVDGLSCEGWTLWRGPGVPVRTSVPTNTGLVHLGTDASAIRANEEVRLVQLRRSYETPGQGAGEHSALSDSWQIRGKSRAAGQSGLQIGLPMVKATRWATAGRFRHL